MLSEISIDSNYLITDSGTSDGTQIKYYYDKKWYKIDRYGEEGACEELASKILELSGFNGNEFVHYKQIMINGQPGCVSEDFLSEDERFITIYRLHLNTLGIDPAITTSKMDYDDAIDYIINFVKEQTRIDITRYLANTFMLDSLILNEDRHFNNLGLIYSKEGFRPAPIFDNGKSLFIGNPRYDSTISIKENKKIAFAKAFSGSFSLNRNYLEKHSTLSLNLPATETYLKSKDLSKDNIFSRLYKLITEG